MAGSSSARKARKFHSRWMEVTVGCLPANMLTVLPKTDQSTSHSNTCHISGSEWSGRSSTESSYEDCLSEQIPDCGDQPFVVYSQRPWKQLLPTLWSCNALDPGPGPGKMHSQAHLPFLLYLRYYFCKETLVLWKGWGTSLSWRETAFHFFSSAILFSKGSSLIQSLIR